MKIAPFVHAIEQYNSSNNNLLEHILVHTGQHYDDRMSNSFFERLGIPSADINLGIGSGSHAEQVGKTMIKFEQILIEQKPDWVVVVGDVNATLASSVTAKKLHVKVCHIEAGLRSGDERMPEEINRLVTDRLSDLLLTPDMLSTENLLKEGVSEKKIEFVGNIMIDTLENNKIAAHKLSIEEIVRQNKISSISRDVDSLGKRFAVLTMHRPSNVDEETVLRPVFNLLNDEISEEIPLIWPIHPRAQNKLRQFRLWDIALKNPKLFLLNPIGYQEILKLNMEARIMLTDSGGLQEECCVLGTPCLTLRWNTERPITLRTNGGASVLVGNNVERIRKEFFDTLKLDRLPHRPDLWDGNTAGRCVNAILNYRAK